MRLGIRWITVIVALVATTWAQQTKGNSPNTPTETAAEAIGGNNVPSKHNIFPGNTTLLRYPKELLQADHAPKTPGLPGDHEHVEDGRHKHHHGDLRKRQNAEQIYISINTCLQPGWNGTGVQTAAPPQLTLYVSTQPGNVKLGPGGIEQTIKPLDQGFANISLMADDGDWFVAVHAPTLPSGFVGFWNFELAISKDAYYHAAEPSTPALTLVDSDISTALFVTSNLTRDNASDTVIQQWMNLTDPFIMFAANANHTAIMGLNNSFCGWSNAAQIAGQQGAPDGEASHVQMGMTTWGPGKKPKERFYITHLNQSSRYVGVRAMVGNSTASGSGVVGGGGKVWKPTEWSTKVVGNCQLMFNLTFCDEVAYAVPANPLKFDIDQLREFYDNHTQFWYQNFNRSLQQIACNTTANAKYSPVHTCDDCAGAYKNWLCAVSIPRCEDFNNPSSWLQKRNVGQKFYNNDSYLPQNILSALHPPMLKAPTVEGSPRLQTYQWAMATNRSRNPRIDEVIQPGPYNEVKPCEDLCYDLVRTCPASMNFGCPVSGRGLEASYGKKSDNSSVTCSFLGAVHNINSADGTSIPITKAVTWAILAALILVVA
ncbi:hypothetical protein K470DRAFT_273176 [Piedraia hortae CBS 480.64]|uniref:FZ domain-containing protein n=1 Tax=Piedraia hortae CBS 480.64 TaxID=1314780 RepID=A0A6A7BQV2_9PEZI|nr:hypothetical protein K470DRAFT_273176 [Piedraia hortae CBS 480.64]